METLWLEPHHWQYKTMFYSSAWKPQKCLHMAIFALHLMDWLLAAASLHSATLSTRCSCNCKIYSSLKPPTAAEPASAAAFSHNAQAVPLPSLSRTLSHPTLFLWLNTFWSGPELNHQKVHDHHMSIITARQAD